MSVLVTEEDRLEEDRSEVQERKVRFYREVKKSSNIEPLLHFSRNTTIFLSMEI